MTRKIINFYDRVYHTLFKAAVLNSKVTFTCASRRDFDEKFHKQEAVTQPVLHELRHVFSGWICSRFWSNEAKKSRT